MADAIVRLKVESQEYDSKLERATQKLQHMEKECRKIGGTFEYVDKEQLDLVKSLGQMETKATTARGKVAEMTKSYTELSLQYKRLSDQEKQSPFGKAMAQSLDQLKSRIKDANSEIKEVSQELGNGSNGLGGIMDALAGKIGIPTELLTKMGLAIGAVGAALKVAQDAFNANESLVDEWGRTVESATSLYEGFVTSLNTGDFGGFLSRMGEISTAARAAYDELDRLGTMKTIQGPEMSRQQAENDRNRAMLQTRRYIAPLDGSAGIAGMNDGDLLSDAQVKQIETDLQNGIQNITALIQNEVQQTTNAIDAEYEKQASILGLTVEEFRKGTSSMAEFDKMIELAKKYYEFEREHTTFTTMQTSVGAVTQSYRDNAVNPYAGAEKWDVFRVDGEAYNNLVKLIQQRDQQMSQAYSSQAQAYRTINRVEGITARGGGALVNPKEMFPPGSMGEIKARIAELNKDLEKAADQTTRDKIRIQIEDLKRELEMMSTPMTGLGQIIPLEVELLDTSKEALDKEMEELRKRLGLEPIKLGVQVGTDGKGTVDAAKQTEKAWGAAANAISAIGGALQQIEDPSAKVAGIIMQAVANIALGFATATTQAAAGGPFAWIAATVAGISNMISAVTAIKQVTSSGKGFANGGIVPGNSFSGDNLHTSDYGINSGELILNRAQQNTIASQLQGGAANIRVQGFVKGHDILLAGSNYALSTGKAVNGMNGIALPIIAG